MTVKIGINGFGRIGRMVFRAAVRDFPDLEIVGINDLLDPDYLAYMLQLRLRARSLQRHAWQSTATRSIVNGKKIRLTAVKDPSELKWGELGVGRSSSTRPACSSLKETCQKHLAAGAKKVIRVGPEQGRDADVRLRRQRQDATPARRSSPARRAPPTAWRRSPRC
jgi:glyceraldehyde 3-phosphate dehydrogenase